jgi:LPXTG-site transpeptidase (sortase) family protein
VPSKAYLALVISLSILTLLTSPPLVRPFLQPGPTPSPTPVTPTATSTPTMTPDPFANVPTATPRADSIIVEVNTLPSPVLGELPPTYTPTPTAPATSSTPTILLPDPTIDEAVLDLFPTPPREAATRPPDHLHIPRLALDVPVAPVGLAPTSGAESGAFFVPTMPPGKVAGWVNMSAPFGQPGNTVLTGRHQAKGLTVFHELWTLEPGDEIVLTAGEQAQRYVVSEVQILPEQDQPIEVRLANAEHIQPTAEERLTIVTGWPEKSNTHRTVVIARPE